MSIDFDRLKAALADRYTVEREIGQGGMAVVYLAEDLKHSRKVAIKVLRPELAATLGAERFLREIETAAKLNHPHILTLHDSGEADGYLYYVMPYVDGESLRQRLERDRQLPVEDALQIAREVADGLAYAHRHGLVHRDIKPGNILLSEDHAVISDFGIAKAVAEAGGEKVTETGLALGSPTYMSPEQAGGDQPLDGRSDLYSAGCVLYEMFAGEPPFKGRTAQAIMAKHLVEAPPSIRNIRPDVPVAVEQSLLRTLNTDPSGRFPDAESFGSALKLEPTAGETLESFVSDLLRRRVPQILAVYLIGALLVLWLVNWLIDRYALSHHISGLTLTALLLLVPAVAFLAYFHGMPGKASWTRVEAVGLPAYLIGVAVTLFFMSSNKNLGGQPDFGDPRKSLIVFPFENQSPSRENDYLQQASANLLSLAIGQWDDMRVYDDERTGSLLRRRGIERPSDIDFETARSLAREVEVGTFVLGDFQSGGRRGDSLRIEAKVFDTLSGERLATETELTTRDGDPREAFDELAARILQVSGAPPGERPDLLAQTTQSLEAYREYVIGSGALQLLETDSARVHLRRAVELDTTFALAYLRLAELEGWAGIESDPKRRSTYTARAVAHSANLPPRYRQLVLFHEAFVGERYRRAREIAQEMIARDSTDVEAWYQLGEAHFHGNPRYIPHADTMGNAGIALRAFQMTLALDSAYVLAYLHIIDSLDSCRSQYPWLCMADSAVYASNDELIERYGQVTVDSIRTAASDERLEAAHGWTVAAPTSTTARSRLTRLLLDAGRIAEAREQVAIFEAQGNTMAALGWGARITYEEQDYGGAAARMTEAVSGDPRESLGLPVGLEGDDVLAILNAGGRIGMAMRWFRQVLPAFPGDTVQGVFDYPYHKKDVALLLELDLLAQLGAGGENTAAIANGFLDVLDAGYGPGSEGHRTRWESSSFLMLGAFLASRDTALLGRFLAGIDTTTTRSRTWRAMEAHLALERGDSVSARWRVEARFRNRDELELRRNSGAMRLFAWADLLVQLGELEEAIAAFALYDTQVKGVFTGSLHVRSWAERGNLYEQLGEPEHAIDMYVRFIDAWKDGDDIVQPAVKEARVRLADLQR